MKRIITFVMSVIISLSFICYLPNQISSAVWFGSEERGEDWLGFTGEIYVIFQHDYSVTFRDYTAEDFPELEIESIKNFWVDPDRDIESMQNNLDYRRRVTITMKDKSEDSLEAAVKYLDELSYVYETFALYDTVAIGDVNCDRNVNLSDALYLLKYIAKWEGISVIFNTGDVNRDKYIDVKDVTRLLQVIAGWEFEFYYQTGPY